MELLHQFVSLLAGLLGWTPETFIALVFGAASAPVTQWVTAKLKGLFDQWGILNEVITGKISGVAMTIFNAVVALAVVFLGGLLFGVNYFAEETVFVGVVGALGINQNVSQWLFHRIKAKQSAGSGGGS